MFIVSGLGDLALNLLLDAFLKKQLQRVRRRQFDRWVETAR